MKSKLIFRCDKMPHDINYILGNPITKDHFVKRGIALIIDLVVIFVIYFIAGMIAIMIALALMWKTVEGMGAGMTPVIGGYFILILLIALLAFIISILYFIIMDAKYGGTIGKKVMGLRVESTEGPMNIMKSIIRNGSKLGGILIGGFIGGYLMIALFVIIFVFIDVFLGTGASSDPRQKYTDIMAKTTVVRTDIPEDLGHMKYVPPAAPAAPAFGETEPSSTQEVAVSTPEDEEKEKESSEAQKEIVTKYQELFGISEERANNLYLAGYKSVDDFKDAIAEDLVLVDKINPTIARSILKKVAEEEPSAD
jgi:uncharacterized RDD family membrane protein YckC